MSTTITITAAAPTLLLASGSRYRAELLCRLRVPFEACPADVDESARSGESAAALAARLAIDKARAVAAVRPRRWVLGSDQVCACKGRILGKPGARGTAIEQLRWLSGAEAEFLTAVALLRDDGAALTALDVTRARFRAFDDGEIERYVDAEPSFDCAGSFKSEGLGIALCASIDSRDPTGLIGLPLIATAQLLRQAGFVLP